MKKNRNKKKDRRANRRLVQLCGITSLVSILFIVLIIDRGYRTLDFSHMPCSIVFLICLIIASVWLNWKNIFKKNMNPRLKDKVILLIANSCTGSLLDILFILIFIFYCSWIPDSIMDYTNGNFFWRPLMFISALGLSILFKPFIPMEVKKIEAESRTVLFTGLSNINYGIRDNKESTNIETVILPIISYPNIQKVVILLSDAIVSNIKNIANNINFASLPNSDFYQIFTDYKKILIESNIHEDLKSLQERLKKSRIELLAIKAEQSIRSNRGLCSNTSLSQLNNDELEQNMKKLYIEIQQIETDTKPLYRKICEQLDILIRAYIYQANPSIGDRCKNIEIEFTSPVDYNNFEECNDRMLEHISAILSRREYSKRIYYDQNLLFNISPGTSIVAGVMTLNAIKGNRGLIYIQQESTNHNKDTSDVVEYDPNIFVLDQQFVELIAEKMEHQNN